MSKGFLRIKTCTNKNISISSNFRFESLIVTGVARGGRVVQLPRAALSGGGTLGVLGSFVRNVLLQIRFKCLAFA